MCCRWTRQADGWHVTIAPFSRSVPEPAEGAITNEMITKILAELEAARPLPTE